MCIKVDDIPFLWVIVLLDAIDVFSQQDSFQAIEIYTIITKLLLS